MMSKKKLVISGTMPLNTDRGTLPVFVKNTEEIPFGKEIYLRQGTKVLVSEGNKEKLIAFGNSTCYVLLPEEGLHGLKVHVAKDGCNVLTVLLRAEDIQSVKGLKTKTL